MSEIARNKGKKALSRKQVTISDHARKSSVSDMREKEALFSRISKQNKLKFYVLYTYDLTKKSKSDKVRFVYVLKGRPGEAGLIEKYKGKFLAPGCFIIPIKHDKDIHHIFELWKIKFKRYPILMH